MTQLFVWLCVLVSACAGTLTVTSQYGVIKARFTRNSELSFPGKTLQNHVIKEFGTKYQVSHCAMECFLNRKCRSFNFDPRYRSCQLNDATQTEYPEDVKDTPTAEFHLRNAFSLDPNAVGPCGRFPCQNNGRCRDTQTMDGERTYMCLCEDGWTGTDCDVKAQHEWSDWDDWGACSATCGYSNKHRIRHCTNKVTGKIMDAGHCYGADKEYTFCPYKACPVWDDWGEWGKCSTSDTCGRGFKERSRTCLYNGVPGVDRYCKGETTERGTCQSIDCNRAVRLVNGSEFGEGRVEMWNSVTQKFYSVCQENWNMTSAEIVCRQNGFIGAYEVKQKGTYEDADDSSIFVTTSCRGDERFLQACRRQSIVTCTGSAGVKCKVKGAWSLWEEWSACSVTCNDGNRRRTRPCDYPPPNHGGTPCPGDGVQYKSCTNKNCPVDGYWFSWSGWSICSVTCANGTQFRTRICNEPLYNGAPCEGPIQENRDCYPRECPVDGIYEPWNEWSSCTKTCGNGTRFRNRSCNQPLHGGAECPGEPGETEVCNAFSCAVDGQYEPWNEWSSCTTTCGYGTRFRNRTCNEPMNGGAECQGEPMETEVCNAFSCAVDALWKPWSAWSECSVTCNTGSAIRSRVCIDPKHGGTDCTGPSEETMVCNDFPCPIDGIFNGWMEWSECSVTCGNGTRDRHRTCFGPFDDGANCTGDYDQRAICVTELCAVDGVWEVWSDWDTCNVTCGGGGQRRYRECIGPFSGGADCVGSLVEHKDCNMDKCPVDAVWMPWSNWTECSASCNGGFQDRIRQCDGPYYGGANCTGEDKQRQQCNSHKCPVDGYFLQWTDWSTCNTTCGGGYQLRSRECREPQYGGAPCDGDYEQTLECNSRNCPVDGSWTNWSNWTDCSVSCGGGLQNRSRKCDGPYYGGAECVGIDAEERTCSPNECPLPGEWLHWAPWSVCSTSCGGGVRDRSRLCNESSYGNMTGPCLGSNVTSEACHTFACRPLARHCSDLALLGLVDSTYVEVRQSDASVDIGYQVYCNMKLENGIGVTIVDHNEMAKQGVYGYDEPGAYKVIPEYGNGMPYEEAAMLVDASANCSQFVEWQCKGASIHVPYNPAAYNTYFINRTMAMTGETKPENAASYFPGGERGSYSCACQKDHTCDGGYDARCNCDMNDNIIRIDSGNITYKADLPLRAFCAGDTGNVNEAANLTIGPLICFGFA